MKKLGFLIVAVLIFAAGSYFGGGLFPWEDKTADEIFPVVGEARQDKSAEPEDDRTEVVSLVKPMADGKEVKTGTVEVDFSGIFGKKHK